jgi:hypothetical protein
VEMASEIVIAESPTLPPVVVDMYSAITVSSATPPAVVDAPPSLLGRRLPPAVVMELQATSVRESFKAKLLELAALELDLKGATQVCSYQSARLAVKCR